MVTYLYNKIKNNNGELSNYKSYIIETTEHILKFNYCNKSDIEKYFSHCLEKNGLIEFSIEMKSFYESHCKYQIHVTSSKIIDNDDDDEKLFNYYKEHHLRQFFKTFPKETNSANELIQKIQHDARKGNLSSKYNMDPIYDYDCGEFGNTLSRYMESHELSGFQVNSNEFKVSEGEKILRRGCNVSVVPKKE